ncbi:hypothetical protein LNJ03_11325 [Tenacibaculum dicentrarchi]|nr:hypothetical protein [Tenacibaculum dicentrarchi]
MKLLHFLKIGKGKQGTLSATYSQVVSAIFEPNVTHLDDPFKVQASWGFQDEKGRKAFIWAYKHNGDIEECINFSVSGNKKLLKDIFAEKVKFI